MSFEQVARIPAKSLLIFLSLIFQINVVCLAQSTVAVDSLITPSLIDLKNTFEKPGDAVQTSIYWYWLSDNISREGVIRDLHAMKKAGINRAFIGNIGLEETPYGKVKMFSDSWWNILHAALKTATELNIEIGLFNSPGWSQSGGPWIKSTQAMRYLISSEKKVQGPQNLQTLLKRPIPEFQDVRVIAYPTPVDDSKTLAARKPAISASTPIQSLNNSSDGDMSTIMQLPADVSFAIDYKLSEPFTARSITFYPANNRMRFEVVIQVSENNEYRTVKKYIVDRSNDALNVGFVPYAPAIVSIPATSSTVFRLMFNKVSPNTALKEIEISAAPGIESYAEKTLAKMYPTPLPYWNEYQWPDQPEIDKNSGIIDPRTVIDISQYMKADGTLNWRVPAGNWTIRRTGMTPTKVTNSPASKEATGLEVDKMSSKHVTAHFDAFLGQIIKRIPRQIGKRGESLFKTVMKPVVKTGPMD